MNKYQAEFFNFTRWKITPPAEDAEYVFHGNDYKEMTLKQGEDIHFTKFIVELTTVFIEKVVGKKNGKEFEFPFSHTTNEVKNHKQRLYQFVLDFEDKIEEITLYFLKGYADPYTFKINYIETDKAEYYAKIEAAENETKLKEMLKAINVQIRKGVDLVNIFFQPVNDNYGKAVVELYFVNQNSQPEMKIADFNVEPGQFYKSITGLAKGSYGVILKQYSTSGKLLIEAPLNIFYI